MALRIIFLFLIFLNIGMGEAGAYLGKATGIDGPPLRLTSSGCAIVRTPSLSAERSPSRVYCLG